MIRLCDIIEKEIKRSGLYFDRFCNVHGINNRTLGQAIERDCWSKELLETLSGIFGVDLSVFANTIRGKVRDVNDRK